MKILFTLILSIAIPIVSLLGQSSTSHVKKLIKSDDLKAISELIANGQNINTTFKRHETLLHYAVEYGKFDIVKFLVEQGADMNIQGILKSTPLLIAISGAWRNDSIAEYLINKGANLNIVGLHGSTALRESIGNGGYGQNFKIFKLLIEKGADINFQCNECCNRTVLLYCCSWGTKEMLQLLIDKNIDINQTDCKGLNGLIYAIDANNIDIIKMLLKTEIDLKHKDNTQRTAIDHAKKKNNKDIIELLKSI